MPSIAALAGTTTIVVVVDRGVERTWWLKSGVPTMVGAANAPDGGTVVVAGIGSARHVWGFGPDEVGRWNTSLDDTVTAPVTTPSGLVVVAHRPDRHCEDLPPGTGCLTWHRPASEVVAFNGTSGETAWRSAWLWNVLPGGMPVAVLDAAGMAILLHNQWDRDGELHVAAIHDSNGTLAWTLEPPSDLASTLSATRVSSAIMLGSLALVGVGDGANSAIWAVDVTNGTTSWWTALDGTSGLRFVSDPSLARLYVQGREGGAGFVAAVEPDTGLLEWHSRHATAGDPRGVAVDATTHIVAALWGPGDLVGFEPVGGSALWQDIDFLSEGPAVGLTSPAGAGGFVTFRAFGGGPGQPRLGVTAFDALTGTSQSAASMPCWNFNGWCTSAATTSQDHADGHTEYLLASASGYAIEIQRYRVQSAQTTPLAGP